MESFLRSNGEPIEVFIQNTTTLLDQLTERGGTPKAGNTSTLDDKCLITELKKMLKTSDFEISKMRECLSCYDTERVSHFCDAVNSRKTQLMLNCIEEHNSGYGELVTDFDWKISLVLGTSTASELQYPVLALNLKTLNSTNSVINKNINFEFTKEELGKIIESLEGHL